VGAWDSGPFDNDDAADFVGDTSELTDPHTVTAALGDALLAVTTSDGYIEAPEMSPAVAAAAIVAILGGSDAPTPSALDQFWFDPVRLLPSNQLRSEAARVFTRELEATDNEWFELWADAGQVDDVRARLASYSSAFA